MKGWELAATAITLEKVLAMMPTLSMRGEMLNSRVVSTLRSQEAIEGIQIIKRLRLRQMTDRISLQKNKTSKPRQN